MGYVWLGENDWKAIRGRESVCRGKKIRFQKKRKTSVGRTGFKSWAPLCDIPTSHLVFVTNSFLKALDIYSIHSLFVVFFYELPRASRQVSK